ncbi:hypothetical protein GMD88_10720 [Pseudoflavonifractor sp. BIOML-A6]|nr:MULTISPECIES: hypothetical protein [unclassified Pseudoflavonifractor]MTQ97474.1 hypothetical protein [Pseudoflavonifractor sp. BIOML-A16]MTR06564.1 hypothetical protein [Pseudoflavonifractor sp. BIOML-A15]MTR31945.1 hypothetical protein [Pseudoflavonifractor sp. BIOML-A14]MTR74067.1 hypothetical protein [Pseudoflavonifractor sp. BIOML-A18]MTS64496.1 hypothetical protein [Pseudoflavonifractor sp. BIOML-A5]MTS72678.1 hypothetical protein [Pseudoflavonifractor sp. BIOML-A8]MTS90224.1 hypoth
MEIVQAWLSSVLAVFQIPITLFGFTFSFWDIFIWAFVAGLLLAFIGGMFNGD